MSCAEDPGGAGVRRATSLSELRECLARFGTEASHCAGLAFRPHSDDVFIATYPKCGTTWVQQIVHQLRTGGDMGFDEITAVVPWLEMALDLGIDLDAAQAAAPRAFKTHLAGDEVPRGARYLVVLRDPRDVLISMYRFFEGWIFAPGSITLEAFAREQFIGRGSRSGRYWDHLLSWWPYRGREDTLMLCYEQMLRAPTHSIVRIARFIGLRPSPGLVERVAHRASLDYMRRHARQFDDHLLRAARNSAMGLPPGGAAGKVRAGAAGSGKGALGAVVLQELEAVWQAEITPVLGAVDYASLTARL